jgi:predicted Zn-dependent protease
MKKIALLSFLVLVACATGKTASKSINEGDINAQAAKAYAEVKAKSKRSNNAAATAMVERVAQRIARASGENFAWEVILIESDELNAWCMPGGKMAVYTGILPVLQTEGALAAVMGHEVAHATLRHGKQRYARAMEQQVLGLVIGGAAILGGQVLCKTQTCKTLTGLGGAAAGFAMAFFDRKYSREDESGADKEGQLFMARAGYDPSEAIRVWERMGAAKQGNSPPEFLSTHPSDERRRGNLAAWLPEANAAYQRAPQQYGIGGQIPGN